MKKLFLVLALSVLFISPSMAIITPSISFLSADQIMSNVLPQGKVDISAKLEYWNANEEYLGNTDLVMEPIAKNHLKVYALDVPVRVSYGLTDNLSLRLSAQFVQETHVWADYTPHVYQGYGLGDSKIEMLYQFTKETAGIPSIALNLGADILSGVNYINMPKASSDTSLPTGLFAPNYYISGIFGKKLGAWDGKAMIGYILAGADKYGSHIWQVANKIIYSICMSTSTGGGIEYGAELSGMFGGENIDDYPGSDVTIQTETTITKISVTPFVTFRQSDNLSYKACVEVPLSMKATTSSANLDLYQYRGLSISLGIDWVI
jgi:hypothetical protein